jgi:hypothetical protein
MNNGQFGILEAVKKAYIFVGTQRRYLLRLALLPLFLHVVTALFLQHYNPDASTLEAFLWAFPANIVFAWFMFAEARLLLLGEKQDCLPNDQAYLTEHRRAMNISVILLLLFDMAMAAMTAWMEWSMKSGTFGVNTPITLSVFFLLGSLFWLIRFSVLHILAAVGYPLRVFLHQIRGMGFSLRLIGMGLLCVIPVYTVFEFLLEMVVPTSGEHLTPDQMTSVILLSAPTAMIVPILLNAAAAYALKDLLGQKATA